MQQGQTAGRQMTHRVRKTVIAVAIFIASVSFAPVEAGDGADLSVTTEPRNVVVGGHRIQIPTGRFLLIRKGSDCAAVKFLSYWTGETERDYFGSYECYYRSDGGCDFSGPGVKATTGQVSYPRFRGTFHWAYQKGRKDLRCGRIALSWVGNGKVSFFMPGQTSAKDKGIEMAPTAWTNISDVDSQSSGVTWYRLNSYRPDESITIEEMERRLKGPHGQGS